MDELAGFAEYRVILPGVTLRGVNSPFPEAENEARLFGTGSDSDWVLATAACTSQNCERPLSLFARELRAFSRIERIHFSFESVRVIRGPISGLAPRSAALRTAIGLCYSYSFVLTPISFHL